MTKAKKDFAADDLAMARRALWLLDDNRPGRVRPPPDLDLNRFGTFVGPQGFLKPLAHFGQRRRDDAELAAGLSQAAPEARADQLAKAPPESVRRNAERAEASRLEKRASDLLREARAYLRTAGQHWRRAAELRADDQNQVSALDLQPLQAIIGSNGDHQAVLAKLSSLEAGIDHAIAVLEPSLRRIIAGDPYPSTLGLPAAERLVALNQQAARLFDDGLSLLEVAYVMDWYEGSDEAIQDKTSKRLAHARSGAAEGG
jgi:hypothetical protein